MKRAGVFLTMLILTVAMLSLGATQTLVNRTGATVAGGVITFSEPVRITSYDKSVFPTQSPASGESESFTFSGGTLPAGGTCKVTWSPNNARVRGTKWITSGSAAALAAIPTTYEEIMAQIAHYPGPDEPLYVPAEGEQIWLTDLEGHADIYDNDSIKVNYASWFEKSQITRIDVYRNGIKMRFLPEKPDVVMNEEMKTFDGNPLEHTPASDHTDHAILGYEYLLIFVSSKGELRLSTRVRSPFAFEGEANACVGHNFYDYLRLPDEVLLEALEALRGAGFTGISLGANHFMETDTSTGMFAQYTHDPAVCEVWKRTPTDVELRRMIRLAKQVGLAVELRVELWTTTSFTEAAEGYVWRGSIAPTNVAEWFRSYGALCERLARLAEEEHVDVFVAGVELNSMQRYVDEWTTLVWDLRRVFSGRITFAEATVHYLAGFNTYSSEARFEVNVGKMWDEFDFIGVNMWPGTHIGMELETQKDQRFSVLVKNLVSFWLPGVTYYGRTYPSKGIYLTELGTFDYDGALVANADFYTAWSWPGAQLDHQEYVDNWAAYMVLAKYLGLRGFSAWTVSLDPSGQQWTGMHHLNLTPAIYTLRAVLAHAREDGSDLDYWQRILDPSRVGPGVPEEVLQSAAVDVNDVAWNTLPYSLAFPSDLRPSFYYDGDTNFANARYWGRGGHRVRGVGVGVSQEGIAVSIELHDGDQLGKYCYIVAFRMGTKYLYAFVLPAANRGRLSLDDNGRWQDLGLVAGSLYQETGSVARAWFPIEMFEGVVSPEVLLASRIDFHIDYDEAGRRELFMFPGTGYATGVE